MHPGLLCIINTFPPFLSYDLPVHIFTKVDNELLNYIYIQAELIGLFQPGAYLVNFHKTLKERREKVYGLLYTHLSTSSELTIHAAHWWDWH